MKEVSPLISVIVPVYNVKEYVRKCLKSIVSQTYKNIEVLVVDDGSTDGSGEICDEFSLSDSRVKVFHKKNGGLSSARNAGLKKAKGEFVCFVDSDDYVRKDFIGQLYSSVDKNEADIAVCGYNDDIPRREVLSGEEATIKLLIQQENIEILAWNKIYRRTLFSENGVEFPEGKKHEDNLTTYKLLSFARRVAYVSESLYVYIERDDSIVHSGKIEERLEMRELAAEEAIKFFKGNERLRAAAEVSLLLAKYAFLDFSISGKIDRKFGVEALAWIERNVEKYKNNQFLTKKLKLYNFMNERFGGLLYRLFRRIF